MRYESYSSRGEYKACGGMNMVSYSCLQTWEYSRDIASETNIKRKIFKDAQIRETKIKSSQVGSLEKSGQVKSVDFKKLVKSSQVKS